MVLPAPKRPSLKIMATAITGVTIPMMRIGNMAAARTAGEFERNATIGPVKTTPSQEPHDSEKDDSEPHARPAPLLRLVGLAAAERLADQRGRRRPERHASRERELEGFGDVGIRGAVDRFGSPAAAQYRGRRVGAHVELTGRPREETETDHHDDGCCSSRHREAKQCANHVPARG